MTCILDGMNFPLSNSLLKQELVICKLKKKVITTAFAMKHCFPTKPTPIGKGFSAIQSYHWHNTLKLWDFLYNLTTNYLPYKTTHDIKPSLSLQKLPETAVKHTDCTASSWQIQQKQHKPDRYIKEHLQASNWLLQFCNNSHLKPTLLDW